MKNLFLVQCSPVLYICRFFYQSVFAPGEDVVTHHHRIANVIISVCLCLLGASVEAQNRPVSGDPSYNVVPALINGNPPNLPAGSKVNGVPIGAGGVTSFNTRTGAVTSQSGDYTAAQVANAADTTASYANPAWITSLIWSKITSTPTTLAGYGITDAQPHTANLDAWSLLATSAKENPLTFQQSLSRSTNTVNLVNDSTTPGNSKYYGTDGGGTRGYFALPSGFSGLFTDLDFTNSETISMYLLAPLRLKSSGDATDPITVTADNSGIKQVDVNDVPMLAVWSGGNVDSDGSLYIGDVLPVGFINSQDNVAIGFGAMSAASTADISSDTAIGYNALRSITTGISNVAIGTAAAQSLEDGNSNVCIGQGADIIEPSGSSMTIVGAQTDAQTGVTENGIGIGYLVNVLTDNTAVIGNSDITDVYLGGQPEGNAILHGKGVIPNGGTTGQFLTKIDNTDYNVHWSALPTPTATATPEFSTIGASTYSTGQHLFNSALSTGSSSGGAITASGTANAVDVAAGTGFIRATDSNVATLSFFNWSASTALSVPSNTVRYIGVQYNAGSPNVVAKTSDSWDFDTEFPLGICVNEGGTRYIVNNTWNTGDNLTNLIERFDSLANIARDNRLGGLILGTTGTRNVTVSAGSLMDRMSEFAITAIDTSASSTFDAYYRDGSGGWTKQAAQTQYDVTKYDNNSGTLANLTVFDYSSRWFYLMTDGTLAMVYGQNQYVSLALGLGDTVPSTVPPRIQAMGMLIGRLVIQQGVNAPAATQTVFTTTFSSNVVQNHNDLANIQGGTSGEYYHLTSSGYTNVRSGVFGFTATNSGSVLGTGVMGYWTAPSAGTISGWSITATGSSPTCTIDVWKIATGTALPTVANTIMGTKPALATGNAIRSTTLTSWNTTINAGDIFGFNIDAVTVATKLTFEIEYTK